MGLLKRIAEAKLSSYALEFGDWEKALRGACQKLIAEGYIDDRYVQAIIGNEKKSENNQNSNTQQQPKNSGDLKLDDTDVKDKFKLDTSKK